MRKRILRGRKPLAKHFVKHRYSIFFFHQQNLIMSQISKNMTLTISPEAGFQFSSGQTNDSPVIGKIPSTSSDTVTNFGTAGHNSLSKETSKAVFTWKGLFARVAGAVVGTVRGALNFLWSPITSAKYLIVAVCQAFKGEGKRAAAALGMALTAPLWAPLDGMAKAYTRFAAWGDGQRELTAGRKENNRLEGWKAHAKEGVIDRKCQKAINGFVGEVAFDAVFGG